MAFCSLRQQTQVSLILLSDKLIKFLGPFICQTDLYVLIMEQNFVIAHCSKILMVT